MGLLLDTKGTTTACLFPCDGRLEEEEERECKLIYFGITYKNSNTYKYDFPCVYYFLSESSDLCPSFVVASEEPLLSLVFLKSKRKIFLRHNAFYNIYA